MTNQTQDIPSFVLAPQQEHAFAHGDAPVTQAAVRLSDGVDADALRSGLARVVERHEILRTTFARLPGLRVPQQVIHEDLSPAWSTSAGRGLDDTLRAEAAAIDLERGPVVRACVAEPPEGRMLILTASAAVLDAHSLPIVFDEIAAQARNEPPTVEPLQYADYAEWRRQSADDDPGGAAAAAAWWERGTPLDRPLLFGRHGAGVASRRLDFELAPDLVAAARDAAERGRVTLATVFEASLHALVARMTGETEVTLAGLADGRAQADLVGAVGPYAQLVPISSRIDEQTTFAELLDQIGRARADATRWQDLASSHHLAAAAKAGVVFAWVDGAVSGEPFVDGRVTLLRPTSSAPLELVVCADPSSPALVFDAAVYDEADVRQMAESFVSLTEAATRDAGARVAALPLLGPVERDEVTAVGDGGTRTISTATIAGAFEASAAKTPDAPAVGDGTTTLSYAEANAGANRLAHHLAAAGVGRGGVVGLFLDRSPEAIVALLGIAKAGAAFMPLNIEHPPSRLEHQLGESEACAVVTRGDLLDRLPATDAVVVRLDLDRDELEGRSDANPQPTAGAEDLAYLMYTSGSTGLPKGVAVTHANVANYTDRMLERFGDVADATFAVVSALSTDLGYTSIFPALAGGATVQLVPPEVVLDPDAFAAHAKAVGIDVLKITPSLLGALVAARGADVLPRRFLVCGGEAFSLDLLARIRETGAACRVLNHYGPTETTIGTCVLEVGEELDAAAATVPIGRPFPNARAYVVDPAGAPTPIGVAGELWIGGAGVARGYLNRADETAARFVDEPSWGRVYRTGDRARFLRDGTIEFLGRIDEQVKIRGYRVEPGEIEAVLLRHEAVRQAAVVAHQGDGDVRLVACVTAFPQPSADELRAYVANWLPEYMVPSFAFLDTLPLTPSGKVDRPALAGFDGGEEAGRGEYVAPRNELEREIAGIWQELLGVERVGVNDDFFGLGGHSLLATQMITRIRRAHGNVPLRALFNAPTVSGLAEAVGGAPSGVS